MKHYGTPILPSVLLGRLDPAAAGRLGAAWHFLDRTEFLYNRLSKVASIVRTDSNPVLAGTEGRHRRQLIS